MAIAAGGSGAGSYLADTDFSGGATYTTSDTINTGNVGNAAPQPVYQSQRYGNFSYSIPNLTPGASYTVRLDFAEIWWSNPGQRVFNVSINGSQVLSNFDIVAAAGGKDVAVAEQFTVTADNSGHITILFTTVKDNAEVNGIEILTGSSGTPAPPSPSAAPPPICNSNTPTVRCSASS